MDPAAFLAGRTRETKIRRDATGRWFNDGVRIEHPNLVVAFDEWLDVAEDGRFCLKNSINWAYVTIEGPALFVRSARIVGDAVELSLSDRRVVPLEAATLREGDDAALYCDVSSRDGARKLVARFDPMAQSGLAPIVLEDERGPYLSLGGERVRPQRVADPLRPE